MKGPGEIFFDQRKRAYLNPEGADRPLKSLIPNDNLLKARKYRLRSESVKLEVPVVVRDGGIERLDSFPFEEI